MDIAIVKGVGVGSLSSVQSSSPAGGSSSAQLPSSSQSQSSSPEPSEGVALDEGKGVVLCTVDEGKDWVGLEPEGTGISTLVPIAFEMRAAASSAVSQVRLTPGELIKGRAKQ